MKTPSPPISRGISYLLIYMTAVYPLHPAFAAGIKSANGNTHVQAGNVPVVNIATPNAAGISHNVYQDFNVNASGAVLNNATAAGASQLAGKLNANANLKGNAAELIINEVTGGSRSELMGKLEVFGNKAQLVIANPNGITCDGCGFINTPNVTLTTGKPQFDKQGALDALEVQKGSVIIGGKGMDVKAQEYVDIISRATELNGKITAQNLALTQGANRISYRDGSVKNLAGQGTRPTLAVDTKALGGMYANKIRLVASESGVGVNLANVVTAQNDLTLTVDGKVSLGNINAKTDLNVSSSAIEVNNSSINAGRDITLATHTLKNTGKIVAGKDMRLFADTATNQGGNALIQANDNLWIQKDASGALSTLVDNISGTIETNTGDVIIRTKKLENRREKFEIPAENISGETKNSLLDKTTHETLPFYNQKIQLYREIWGMDFPMGKRVQPTPIKINPNETTIKKFILKSQTPRSVIASGRNIYLRADSLNNNQSDITAKENLILTGNNFQSSRLITGFEIATNLLLPSNKKVTEKIWVNDETYSGKLQAGGGLILDFKDSIAFGNRTLAKIKEYGYPNRALKNHIDIATAKNILIKSKSVTLNSGFKASQNFTAIVDNTISIDSAILQAGNELAITSINNITTTQSQLKGKNINLLSRTGDVRFNPIEPRDYGPDKKQKISQISAQGNLDIFAGKTISFENVSLEKPKQITFTAGSDIQVARNESTLTYPLLGTKLPIDDVLIKQAGLWESSGDITLSAGKNILLQGMTLTSDKSITLGAGQDINLAPRASNNNDDDVFKFQRRPEMRTQLTAKDNITLNAARDINLQGVTASAANNTTVFAGRNLTIGAIPYSAIPNPGQNPKDDRHWGADIQGGKGLTLAANGALTVHGSKLHSAGDVRLSSNGNMRFESVRNIQIDGSTENYTQQSTELNSGANLTVISNGSILFQATKLAAKGAMDIAAKGGFLYAQAMEEFYRWEEEKKRCKGRFGIGGWCPLGKKTITKHRAHAANKVTEFTAGGDITLMARDDITLEAAKINTAKNAKLTSQKGKINYKAVKDTRFEQTITKTRSVYITHEDEGFIHGKWVLPSIYTGGKLTVTAAKGINADVKAKAGQSLEQAIDILGNSPGYEWLKPLKSKENVNWNQVKDTYTSWYDEVSNLNPVFGAIIAVAAAVVTYGSSLATTVGGMAASSAGSAAASAGASASAAAMASATAGAAAQAGLATIASQAAVALAQNKGDLPATFKTLANSDSVKSLATSMIIGGALGGLDKAMGWTAAVKGGTTPVTSKLLITDNATWNSVAQRVAAHSVVSSALGTAIQGGSFADNLKLALLSNIGSQLHAEGASLIGDNGQILDIPGKAVSHAVVSAVAAEIGGGNAKGAAVGALAAELAGVMLGDNLIKPEAWQRKSEQQAQMARVLGAVAGGAFTGKASGVYSGATGGENAFRYNYLSHQQKMLMNKDLAAAKTMLDKAFVLARWGVTSGKQDGAFAAGVVSGVPVEFVETAQSLIALVTNPGEAWDALRALINEDDAWEKVSTGVKQGYINRINTMKAYYEKAGVEGAYYSGLEFGKLATEAAGVLVGGAGIAKIGTKLTANTVKALQKAAVKDAHSLVDIRNVVRIEKNGSKTQMSWMEGNYKQGYPFEDYMVTQLPKGSRLPEGFKAFDFYDVKTKTAISVKTLNTNTPSRIKDPKQLYTSIKGNIDDVVKFQGDRKLKVILEPSDITKREVIIAIPKTTSTQQWEQINKAIVYGSEKNVKVKITVVKE
ncbi:DUF637 domain-containing protein [Candidatus Symbiopectobacterium sp. NZEC127]|uniref:two-partner secretion domain-containing protein n=1 Tax=Candidatus Symbiopectobacterium sp. NZEC127 TaxID=2820472 RepID=UPI0022265022|nr:DUF637 domain-containing protein [Candidatus Symbiopectobacterium sp. NZEC127]MCW2487141.1 DUF637 domain-containing protein [Candidatus Symbiopectobacterium sp. NZEC127]